MAATAHILTVNVEEYFQALPASRVLRPRHWAILPSRMDRNIDELLAFFEQSGVSATFFVPRWHAERQSEIVTRILASGHEIAARGRLLEGANKQSFSEDLAHLEAALQGAGASEIMGYRSGIPIRVLEDWQQAALLSRGYRYDASLERPSSHVEQLRSTTALASLAGRTCRMFSRGRILSDCSSLRSIPSAKLRATVAALAAPGDGMLFSMQSWELDSDLPRITALSRKEAARQYGRLDESRAILDIVFETGNFDSIQATFGFEPTRQQQSTAQGVGHRTDSVEQNTTRPVSAERTSVCMVVPLYNEQEGLDYLANTMTVLTSALERDYAMQYILVDDGSNDSTWEGLQHRFAARDDCKLVCHEVNQGVSGAILTGIRASTSEIVCSMDADCSYDPLELVQMLPMIEEAELVTASPYHPDGVVLNVPAWRLFLSKGLSRLYGLVLRKRFHTFTSCFRVYRRSAILELELKEQGFLGIAETLIRLVGCGGRAIEYPTTLETRLLGQSKMKVMKTVRQHLFFLAKLLTGRKQKQLPSQKDRPRVKTKRREAG